MDFEHQLRSALERKQPSPDFAARVIASAGKGPEAHSSWSSWRRWIAIPIAASVLVLAVGIERQHERQRGEAAKAQLMQALEITSGKLDKIQKKVRGTLK